MTYCCQALALYLIPCHELLHIVQHLYLDQSLFIYSLLSLFLNLQLLESQFKWPKRGWISAISYGTCWDIRHGNLLDSDSHSYAMEHDASRLNYLLLWHLLERRSPEPQWSKWVPILKFTLEEQISSIDIVWSCRSKGVQLTN